MNVIVCYKNIILYLFWSNLLNLSFIYIFWFFYDSVYYSLLWDILNGVNFMFHTPGNMLFVLNKNTLKMDVTLLINVQTKNINIQYIKWKKKKIKLSKKSNYSNNFSYEILAKTVKIIWLSTKFLMILFNTSFNKICTRVQVCTAYIFKFILFYFNFLLFLFFCCKIYLFINVSIFFPLF